MIPEHPITIINQKTLKFRNFQNFRIFWVFDRVPPMQINIKLNPVDRPVGTSGRLARGHPAHRVTWKSYEAFSARKSFLKLILKKKMQKKTIFVTWCDK